MDYTDLDRVKAALGATETTDDGLLAVKITEASRVLDKTICNGEPDYFARADVTNEMLLGKVNKDGAIICWASKAVVNEVTSFEYRFNPRSPWVQVDLGDVTVSNRRQVTAWNEGLTRRSAPCFVRLSYDGGYAELSTDVPPVLIGLSEDVINAATVMAVRLYREEKGGLTDTIGVAELGTLQYTKALPDRVLEQMQPYIRRFV